MALEFKIDVNATPAEVFEYVADIAQHGDWANPKAGLHVEPVSGGPTGVGARFKSSQRFLGKDTGADITVTRYEPPRMLAFDAIHPGKKGPERYTSTFTFTPENGGTRVERRIDRDPPMGIMGVIAKPAVKADAMKALRNLKAGVESHRRGAS
jgi:uncharacterized protein YndB with AHSA1/START domain